MLTIGRSVSRAGNQQLFSRLAIIALAIGIDSVSHTSLNAAKAQGAPIDVCTGLRTTLPTLVPVGQVTSGLLAGLLDPILNGIVGNVNTNLGAALSGQTLGVSVLDRNGNLVSFPSSNCNIAADNMTVNADQGITMGGGRIDGLGGQTNAVAVAGEVNSIAIGNGSTTAVSAANAISIGLRGSVTAIDGVALGRDASVTAAGGVAMGAGSIASRAGLAGGAEFFSGTVVNSSAGAVSVGAIGGERQITNVAGGTQETDAVNVRQLRSVGTNLASAFGGGASFSANGTFTAPSFMIGGNTYFTVADAFNAINNSTVTAPIAANNTAGLAAPVASGTNDLAIGYGAVTSGQQALAVGTGATASASASTAVGAGAIVAGSNATALGQGASANGANSTAIGSGATTTRANQVSVGTQQSTYTLNGISGPQSNAAQSGPVQFVTTDANGNLGTANFDPSGIEQRMTNLAGSIVATRQEARQGIAAAMAMSPAPMPSAPGRTTWSINTAMFLGELATSLSVAHRLPSTMPLMITGSFANGGATQGGRVGLSGEF